MATGGRGFRAALVAASFIAFAVFLAGRNAAAEDTLFVSKRITPQGEYTAGIEGPAVDASGNLYVVNFQQKRQHRQAGGWRLAVPALHVASCWQHR